MTKCPECGADVEIASVHVVGNMLDVEFICDKYECGWNPLKRYSVEDLLE